MRQKQCESFDFCYASLDLAYKWPCSPERLMNGVFGINGSIVAYPVQRPVQLLVESPQYNKYYK